MITRSMAKNKKKSVESNAVGGRAKARKPSDSSGEKSGPVTIRATAVANSKAALPAFAGPPARHAAAADCVTASNVAHPVEPDSAADDHESEDSSSSSSTASHSDLSAKYKWSPRKTSSRTVGAPVTPVARKSSSKERRVMPRCPIAVVPPSFWAIVAAIALSMGVAAIYWAFFSREAANVPPRAENRDFRLQLLTQFPGQARRFYNTIAVAVQAVQTVTVQPQPVALLFVSSNSTVRSEVLEVAKCLAHLLERNLTGRQNAAIIEGTAHEQAQPDDSKYHIDQQLEAHFSSNSRVALVTDIEKLSLTAAKIFYKYCDHENAPHKNVVFVLTITVGDEPAESQIDFAIEAALLKSWSPHLDEVSPILTRVTNYVLRLRPLQKFMCQVNY